MKYMGSKSRFAKAIYAKICELSPRNGRPWVEPFAGGMNMICEVPHEDGPRYANDSNEYLIAMFKAGSNGWIPPKRITREFYEKCRNLEEDLHFIGWAGIACSYSGKWFGGYAGDYPESRRKKNGELPCYQLESYNSFLKQIAKLNEVWYCSASYDEITIPENSIVYCDPPYEGTTGYGFEFNHIEFWNWIRQISKEHDVFISEYNAPGDFECVWQSETQSQMSANGKSGGTKISIEKLFRLKNV